ncbi:Uncharacterised protein [Mycobacteroides abscessus subsp. abscessus]|nr:Uncharacterised protein [Mycobacteroides abscessus subsp. abscessus]
MPRGPCGLSVRSKRDCAYASYLRTCSGVAESVGITTSPCDTRADDGSGWFAR